MNERFSETFCGKCKFNPGESIRLYTLRFRLKFPEGDTMLQIQIVRNFQIHILCCSRSEQWYVNINNITYFWRQYDKLL